LADIEIDEILFLDRSLLQSGIKKALKIDSPKRRKEISMET
jgi:hypothetical protein